MLGRPMPEERAIALRRVGAIVEEPRFHPHLTGRENLRVVAAAREREADDRIPGALARVGLTARADERVARYSMGMRQRLGVARCLLADPQLLILDEPMNGLDPAGIQEFREMVANLVDEGRTVFLSSHLLDEVEKTCEQVAIIDRGRILMQGAVTDIARTGKPTVRIRCGDLDAAATLIPLVPDVEQASREDGSLVVVLGAEPGNAVDAVVAELNRRLVGASVPVYSIEPERVSLEARFLEMTSRLEDGHEPSTRERGMAEAPQAAWALLVVPGARGRRRQRGVHHSREILHLNNPAHYDPPGGIGGLQGSIIGLSLAGSVAAILVGSAAGTADVSTACSATWSRPGVRGGRSSSPGCRARFSSICRSSRSATSSSRRAASALPATW